MKEETLRKAIQEKRAPSESPFYEYFQPEGEPVSELSKGPAAPKEVPAPAESVSSEIVTFYWRDGKNITFSAKQVAGSEDGRFYKSKDSVIKLDKKNDAKAIEYLRAHKSNEANGGREFGEFNSPTNESSGKGATLEKLMSLDVKTLANMAGGGIAATRKPKGQLISEIMGLK